MTQYTFLNPQDFNTIATRYGISRVLSHKILSGGSENTNFLIRTATTSYVLTICEQKSMEEARNLALLLEHLKAHDFETSEVIRSAKDELVTAWKGKPVILKSFIEGDIMDDLPVHLLEHIGRELGRLHQVPPPDYLQTDISYVLEHFDEVELYAAQSEFSFWLQAIKKNTQKYISPDLPKVLIHSDLFTSNVIVSSDETSATIMDFEEASNYYRIFDIGMSIIGLCREGKTVNLDKIKAFLKGYTQEIDLLPIEKTALQAFTAYAAAAMSFWRHKNFNYTNPTPEMATHYVELKEIADSILVSQPSGWTSRNL